MKKNNGCQWVIGFILIYLALIPLAVWITDNAATAKPTGANQTISKDMTRENRFELSALSPDGSTLAIVDADGKIKLLDLAASGQTKLVLPGHFSDTTIGLVFSPDGKTLANIGNSTITLLDLAQSQARSTLFYNSAIPFDELVFSPEGKTLAGVSHNAHITLWNSLTGAVERVIDSHQKTINGVAFSPDGLTLASAGAQIGLWEVATGRARAVFPAHKKGAAFGATLFSPDGTLVASIGKNARITLLDAHSGSVKQTLSSPQGSLDSIAFSPDGTLLASGGSGAQIELWEVATGRTRSILPGDAGATVTQVVFNREGTLLASVGADNRVGLWEVSSGELLRVLAAHSDRVIKVAFNANPEPTLTSIGENGQVIIWDVATGMERLAVQVPIWGSSTVSQKSIESGNPLQQAAIGPVAQIPASGANVSPGPSQVPATSSVSAKTRRGPNTQHVNRHDWHGILAFAVDPNGMLFGSGGKNGAIRLWDAHGKERLALKGHHGADVTGVAFGAHGKRLFTAAKDTEIHALDIASGQLSRVFRGQEHPIRAIATSADGRFLASAGEETRIMLWNAETGKLVNILTGNTDFVNAVGFSANGKLLASAGADATVCIWKVASGQLVQKLLGHAGAVNAVAFSPDGRFLVSGGDDNRVILWDISTGRRVQALEGHQAAVRSVAFAPNGRFLMSAGEDRNILVWNTATRKLSRQISGAAYAINTLAFGRKGHLFSGSEDGQVTEWDVENDKKLQTIQTPPEPQARRSGDVLEYPSPAASPPVADIKRTRPTTTKPAGYPVLSQVLKQLLDWAVPAAEAAIPNPPGGPILVVKGSGAGTFNEYYAEILRTEGFDEFAVANDIDTLYADALETPPGDNNLYKYDAVVLGQMPLSAAQATMLAAWVNAGGNLIAMRPAAQLSGLLGLTGTGATLSDAYLRVDTSRAPGNGIAGQAIQFHGTADRYTLNGAASLATLYTNPAAATANPALTLRSVGAGQAAAFAYDLATSIVYTRQGNPAWQAQERDGLLPIRSDDKFYGNAAGDPKSDWVDLQTAVGVPQADEQQRLFANLITQMNLAKKPLPRFWYFPRGEKAVVIMTGDDHANGGTAGRFDQFLALSPQGCSVADWECVRGTSYIFVEPGNLSAAQAAAYTAQGFEVGLHVNTNCADWSAASLESFYAQQTADFLANYPGIPAPITQRHHCIAWSDWTSGAQTESNHGIRLDTSYYFWPAGWVNNRPGYFTGSAMPMRFAALNGNLIDVYQASTHMTDESGQSYPYTVDTLLDLALGSSGYYGAYTVNAHTDMAQIPEATSTVASAQSRGVPVVSGAQMLAWLDGRNNSAFGNLSWAGNTLDFTVAQDAAANGLQAMLPTHAFPNLSLTGVTGPGGAIGYSTDIVKGIEYALVPVVSGAYAAAYGIDATAPTVGATTPPSNAIAVVLNGAPITATFSEPVDPASVVGAHFTVRAGANPPVSLAVSYDAATRSAQLTPTGPLADLTLYSVTIATGIQDLAGNTLAAPYTWSFMTGITPVCPCSAWNNLAIPLNPAANDPGAVELGVKFKVDFDGVITGIRFYKGIGNTGTHIGNLWDSNGNNLAHATFANETAAGWQQVVFANPVPVTANTVYVASYFAPNGHYAYNQNYFVNEINNTYIHFLQDGASGGNGVYAYSADSIFPASTYLSTNYWVDVLFTPGAATASMAVVGTDPANGDRNVSSGETGIISLTATFNNTIDQTTVSAASFTLKDAHNVGIPATLSVSGNTAVLTPNTPLAPGAAYTATLAAGIKDNHGSALATDYVWFFTTDDCAAPHNAIIAENCQTGNPPSQWEVSGPDLAGDPSIQGFATDISVNQGERVDFKINSQAAYRLDIYRMGYYQGNGARLVGSITPLPGINQPACLTHAATGLIDCGNWAVSASWTAPNTATSGIYFARISRLDTGGASHIFFVVRNDAGHSDLLFQTADATWQAYNDYGGNSFYTGSPVGRAYKVSYNRPFHTRVYEPESWVFNAEYPMVRWLEANGYDVSYSAQVDSERHAALLQNHRVWLANGHDEYWSGSQRAHIQAARDAGLHLAFFSGNTLFWKTRWENNIVDATGTLGADAYRTLVCYKETHANGPLDPLDAAPDWTWTGTWRDPRFSPPADGGQPENALVGSLFRMNGGNAAITVPQADGRMRFWRGTSVAALGSGQTATLAPGSIGAEWDDDEDNGFRPAGLFGLSSTPISDSSNYLLDYGSNYGAGTATHKLTLYKAPSGAWVFASGTYQWSWGLDANHDRSYLGAATDIRMQQATVNLLADMGVQPAKLQTGLTAATASSDVTAPTAAITAPAAGASLMQGVPVTISGTAADGGGGVVGGVEISLDGGTTWHPADGRETWSYTWTPIATGPVTLASRAVDDSGNLGTPGGAVNITVLANSSACVGNTLWPASATPAVLADSDTSAVEIGVKFRPTASGSICGIRFYKASTNTGTHVGKLWSSTGTLLASATFANETASGWQQVNFASPVAVTANTPYVASYHVTAGHYSASTHYFAVGVTSGQLYAFGSAESGGNGVYLYGAGGFPSHTFNAANYWVDVVFNPGP